ncbi:MAG: hypothetical protein WC595_05405 [Candidatus Nanoarchaeia archaeon]
MIATWRNPSPIYEPTINFLATALSAHSKSEEIKKVRSQLGDWEIPKPSMGNVETRAMVRQGETSTFALYLPQGPRPSEPIPDSGFYQIDFPRNQPPLSLITDLDPNFFKGNAFDPCVIAPIDRIYDKLARTRSELSEGRSEKFRPFPVEQGFKSTHPFARFFITPQPAGRTETPAYFGKLAFTYHGGNSVSRPVMYFQLGSLRNNQPSSFTPVHSDVGAFLALHGESRDGDSINYEAKAEATVEGYMSLIAHAGFLAEQRSRDLDLELFHEEQALRGKQSSFKGHVQSGLEGLFGVPQNKLKSGK